MEDILKTKVKIDTLWVSYSIDDIDLSNRLNIDIFANYFKQFGCEESPKGRNCYLFDTGLGLSFYIGFKSTNSKNTHLQVKADGKYNYLNNAFENVYKILKEIQCKFGLIPVVQRIDIMQNLMSRNEKMSSPFNYLPDFREVKKAKMKLKGSRKTKYHYPLEVWPHYNDLSDKTKMTGVTTGNSRFLIKSYSKILQIEQDYKKGKISQGYYEYWKGIFSKNKTKSCQRFEVLLSKESCSVATALIFCNEKISEEKICRKVLSFFGKSHRVYDYNPQTGDYDISNQIWDELFFISEYQSLKELKEEHGISPSLKSFKNKPTVSRSIESLTKSLAKALNREGYEKVEFILESLYQMMKEDIEEKQDELSQYEETLMFFGTTKEELDEIKRQKFYFKDRIKSLDTSISERETLIESLMNTKLD